MCQSVVYKPPMYKSVVYPNISARQHHRTPDSLGQDYKDREACAESGALGEGEEVGLSEVGLSAAWEDSGSWQLPLDDSVRR